MEAYDDILVQNAAKGKPKGKDLAEKAQLGRALMSAAMEFEGRPQDQSRATGAGGQNLIPDPDAATEAQKDGEPARSTDSPQKMATTAITGVAIAMQEMAKARMAAVSNEEQESKDKTKLAEAELKFKQEEAQNMLELKTKELDNERYRLETERQRAEAQAQKDEAASKMQTDLLKMMFAKLNES